MLDIFCRTQIQLPSRIRWSHDAFLISFQKAQQNWNESNQHEQKINYRLDMAVLCKVSRSHCKWEFCISKLKYDVRFRPQFISLALPNLVLFAISFLSFLYALIWVYVLFFLDFSDDFIHAGINQHYVIKRKWKPMIYFEYRCPLHCEFIPCPARSLL